MNGVIVLQCLCWAYLSGFFLVFSSYGRYNRPSGLPQKMRTTKQIYSLSTIWICFINLHKTAQNIFRCLFFNPGQPVKLSFPLQEKKSVVSPMFTAFHTKTMIMSWTVHMFARGRTPGGISTQLSVLWVSRGRESVRWQRPCWHH